MTQLLEVVERLTEEERREVRDFAEFLLQRRVPSRTDNGTRGENRKINFEGWAGCLSHVDKTAVELAHEANDLRVAWAEPKE